MSIKITKNLTLLVSLRMFVGNSECTKPFNARKSQHHAVIKEVWRGVHWLWTLVPDPLQLFWYVVLHWLVFITPWCFVCDPLARQEKKKKETNEQTKKNNLLECDHLCGRLRAVSYFSLQNCSTNEPCTQPLKLRGSAFVCSLSGWDKKWTDFKRKGGFIWRFVNCSEASPHRKEKVYARA